MATVIFVRTPSAISKIYRKFQNRIFRKLDQSSPGPILGPKFPWELDQNYDIPRISLFN